MRKIVISQVMSRRIVLMYKGKKYNNINEIEEALANSREHDPNAPNTSIEELKNKFGYVGEHTIDSHGNLYDGNKQIAMGASKKRRIAMLDLFDSKSPELWEAAYTSVLDLKYQKSKRNFSRKITGNEYKEKDKIPPIYLIAKQGCGSSKSSASYKDIDVIGATKDDIAFMPISKGFSMQGLSSFTIGPIVGEGLCLVNAAFSKIICVFHIEGGGCVDITKPNFWRRSKTPLRNVGDCDEQECTIDGKVYNTVQWLRDNEDLWLKEWDVWRKHVALCSVGNFNWNSHEADVILGYRYREQYLSFIEWKKECYIKPAYELIPHTPEYKFIKKVWLEHRRPIGLVHPMTATKREPVTKEMIRNIYDSYIDMSCMPYVVIGALLGVSIY